MACRTSPTRDGTCAPAVEAQSLNHWTTREVLGTNFVRLMIEIKSKQAYKLYLTGTIKPVRLKQATLI